jgi:hypothetical protein
MSASLDARSNAIIDPLAFITPNAADDVAAVADALCLTTSIDA